MKPQNVVKVDLAVLIQLNRNTTYMTDFKFNTTAEVETETDFVGGGSRILESNIYDCTIETAYRLVSKAGAMGIALSFKTSDGRYYKQTVYITSGDKKGNKTYYVKEGKNYNLPGYNQVNSLTLLTVGKKIDDLIGATEDKVIKLWDNDLKKEVPKTVPMIMALKDQKVKLCILQQIVSKMIKKEGTDFYVPCPTGATKEENDINKVLRASDSLTVNEVKAKATSADFAEKWLKTNEGEVKTKLHKDAPKGAAATTSGGAASAPADAGVEPNPFANTIG